MLRRVLYTVPFGGFYLKKAVFAVWKAIVYGVFPKDRRLALLHPPCLTSQLTCVSLLAPARVR